MGNQTVSEIFVKNFLTKVTFKKLSLKYFALIIQKH